MYCSWQRVSPFLNTLNAKARNLEVGKEYEFRVMAENEMGVSEPLETIQPIKARYPFGKFLFKFFKNNMSFIIITIKFIVLFSN